MSAWQQAAQRIAQHTETQTPRVGIILGSGLGALAKRIANPVCFPFAKFPGFPPATVSGHAGQLILGSLGGVQVACMQGRAHVYEGHPPHSITVSVRTLKALGCTCLLQTNSAGGIRPDLGPGELMLVVDHINWSGFNPLIGHNDETVGPRFFDMSNAYDADLAERMRSAAAQNDIRLHSGVYVYFVGPSFETPAEIRAVRVLGGDAVGMSTVPETLAAVHCGLKVAAISTITNHAAGIGGNVLTHAQTLNEGGKAAEKLGRLIIAFLQSLPADHSPGAGPYSP